MLSNRLQPALGVALAVASVATQLMLQLMLLLPPGASASSEWQPWEAHAAKCSTTCGQGVRCRKRACVSLTAAAGLAEVNMDNCPGGEKASRDCLPCRAYVECPTNGVWGGWSQWTECQLNKRTEDEQKAIKDVSDKADSFVDDKTSNLAQPMRGDSVELDSDCGQGLRHRERKCDHPPPGPKGLLCRDEGRVQNETCEIPCSADMDLLSVVKSLLSRDLEENPNQLNYVNYGAPATLDCENSAYTLALRGVQAYQDLQIQWRLNNQSVTALVSKLQKFMVKKSEEKKTSLHGSAQSDRGTKLETGQLRSFGTQLTIDPVDSAYTGVYACYMVLDGEYYLMRSFTLLTRQLPNRQFVESDSAKMPTNAETFVDPQVPLLEAASVLWYHNGVPNRQHMLADWKERDWDLTLAYKDTGAWECYMVLGDRQWKTNEFQLSISRQASFIQKFDDTYLTYFLASCALILYAVFGFPLAVVTLRQREDNYITAEEQRCIEYVRQINYLYMARYVRRITEETPAD